MMIASKMTTIRSLIFLRIQKLFYLSVYLLISMCLSGCKLSSISEPNPLVLHPQGNPNKGDVVAIISPSDNAVLTRGESVELMIEVDSWYAVEQLKVELRNMQTKESYIWRFNNPANSATFSFSRSILIPPDMPVGGAYRLMVTAQPSRQTDEGVAMGYSTVVHVRSK